MLNFIPKTEKELSSINLFEPGTCAFEIIEAFQKNSKNGNPMIELKIRIWDKNGREKIISDYLVVIPEMEFKIKHFCDATGLEDKYNSGTLEDIDCVNKNGQLKLTITKDKSGKYPDKNTVLDYIKKIEFNDNVPF